MGLFVPQVLGVGYEYVGQVLNNHLAFKIMILLVILKLFAVTTSYGSGNAGGIFGPALFLGAIDRGARSAPLPITSSPSPPRSREPTPSSAWVPSSPASSAPP